MNTITADMFFSKWHLITLVMIIIAFVSLIIGRYDKRTILRSGGGAILTLYIITTIPIATLTYQENTIQNQMLGALDRIHEENGQELVAMHGSFRDDDSYDIRIFAGNYSSTETFHGTVTVTLFNEKKESIDVLTYEDVTLTPGEKKQIDQFTTYDDETDTFNFRFLPE